MLLKNVLADFLSVQIFVLFSEIISLNAANE